MTPLAGPGRRRGWRKYGLDDWRDMFGRNWDDLAEAYGTQSRQDLADAFGCSRNTLRRAQREFGFGSTGPPAST